jgi:nitroreductase
MTQMMADTKVITTAVELACRAPSLHNSQPWRWVASSTSLDLFVDPHRTVTSTDRSGREAIISCGAALDHFRVAMAAVGWGTNVEQFPNPNNLAHLASIDFTSLDYVTQARRDRANRYCVAGPTDYRSARRSTGRRSNPYCVVRSKTIRSPLTSWPTTRDRGWSKRLDSPKPYAAMTIFTTMNYVGGQRH